MANAQTGLPLAGATVSITYQSGKSETVATGPDGTAALTPSELGLATVRATRDLATAQVQTEIYVHAGVGANWVTLIPGILNFVVDCQSSWYWLLLSAVLTALVAWFVGGEKWGPYGLYVPAALLALPVIGGAVGGACSVITLTIPAGIWGMVVYWAVTALYRPPLPKRRH